VDTIDQNSQRSYEVRTYGCQMNVHDSERLSGLLEDAGYTKAATGQTPDLVVFNTCAVRENADNKLYGNLSHLAPAKEKNPDMQIAVGGCLAQKDREVVVKKAPWVDVVFGTHNIGSLPALLDRARHNQRAEVEILDALEAFPSTLPAKRESAYAGWVSISVGCNNTCTFCIVPALRGKEVDRRPGDILAEVQALVNEGVLEVTLLGQNVNAYGVLRRPGAAARSGGVRRTAARMRRDRRTRADPIHVSAPGRVHRRRHRGHGGNSGGLPATAHAASVRLRPRTEGDAAFVPDDAVSGHHREGPRCDAARGDHHRHHRRFPR
jgi:tRNA A37 methylthiotransferase MiaB